MNPEDDEMEIDAALVLAKKIKLRTIHGIIIGTDLRVYECEDPYVLIFLFVTELSDEFRLDIFKEDLSKELKYWLEGKYLRNPAVLVPTRIEESIMKFIKFAKTPKQEDLIMWILSRCEFYPSQSLGGGTNLRSPPSIIFGGKFSEDNNNHNENEQKLETIKQTILQNRYPKTSAIAAAKASKDDSHYILPSTHSLMFEGEDATDQHQSRSLQRSRSSGGRSLSTGRGIKTTTFDLKQHNKEIFQTNDDLGMFQLTKSLLGKSQTIQSMHKSQLKNRIGATSTINKQNFTNDHWRLYNEIQRTRQDIKSNLNDRRKLIEIAKTRQLQKTTKFQTIKKDIKNQKGANEFIENATNELSILKQIQTNIQDDLKQQKIKITRGTQRVIWTMAPNGYVNLRGKAQRGPVIGPGPLPPNATTDLKDPTLEITCKKYYWDTAGRRHLRKHGIDYDAVEESLLEQAMNAIRKLSQNISSYKLNLKDVFERFDTSGDGFLSAQEMAEAFLAMGVKLDIPTMQAIFDHFDPNHSGSVHYGEFVWAFFNRRKIVRQWKQKTKHLTLSQIQSIFHQYDINGNGSLSITEFKKLLINVFHITLNQQELDTLINQFDVNHDGEIDINEFLIFIQSEQKNFEEMVNNPNIPDIMKNKKTTTMMTASSLPRPPSTASRKQGTRRSKSPSSRSASSRGVASLESQQHHRTAPAAIEHQRIFSSRKGKTPATILEGEEAEEENDHEHHQPTASRSRNNRGGALTYEEEVKRLQEEIDRTKSRLSQTDSKLHMLQRHNKEIVKENQKPSNDRQKEAVTSSSVEPNDKQRQRIERLIDEATLQAKRDESNPTTVDVNWIARMLQAQAEIEGRLGRRYYKNNS